jgi:hypothetical protein
MVRDGAKRRLLTMRVGDGAEATPLHHEGLTRRRLAMRAQSFQVHDAYVERKIS